jgi:ABC-type nitrate/sulfonate/bicarbonate transport system substrate-binding protein
MKKRTVWVALVAIAGIITLALVVWRQRADKPPEGASPALRVALAPYQDLAMLVNAEPLGLYEKSGVNLKLFTMAWEEILPAVASAGQTVDVGFGSYVEYLTKAARINQGSSDPLIYFQPLYVYKGGGFISLRPDLVPFTESDLASGKKLQRLKEYKIGAQKESLYDMMLYSVAARGGLRPKELKVFDTPMNDGLLALQAGGLDMAAGGLTQVAEAQKRGGRIVLSMEDAGFADITGFICKKSVLEKRRPELEALVRMWFASVDFVMTDLRKNSSHSLKYLKANAATQYTFDEYSRALSQELLPRSQDELRRAVLLPGSKYDFKRIGSEINAYLSANGIVSSPMAIPVPMLGQ